MANDDSTGTSGRPKAGFQVSTGPVVGHGETEQIKIESTFGELPRVYGGPILFAIPRDPHTLFAYWNIDWWSVFADAGPVDRQVFLRVKNVNGRDESELLIEPMLGNYHAPVNQPNSAYRVEIGYYQPAGVWNSVAISEAVTMPPESASENVNVDVATVPFHLSFQRMIDLFRASSTNALMDILSRLQARAVTEEDGEGLSPEELEILRAMNLSLSDMEAARRAFARGNDDLLRKRAEAVLGFGSTSPSGGFSGSSWS